MPSTSNAISNSQPAPTNKNPTSNAAATHKRNNRPESIEDHSGLVVVGSPGSMPGSVTSRSPAADSPSRSFSHRNQRPNTASDPPVRPKHPKNWRPKTATQADTPGHKARWRQRVQQSDMGQEIIRNQVEKEKQLGYTTSVPGEYHAMLNRDISAEKSSSRAVTPLNKEMRKKEAATLVEVLGEKGELPAIDKAVMEKRLAEALKKLGN